MWLRHMGVTVPAWLEKNHCPEVYIVNVVLIPYVYNNNALVFSNFKNG